jgi:hypothetical protein
MREPLQPLIDWFCPELKTFPDGARRDAWRRARRTPFDVTELFGMAAGLVIVTALTGQVIEQGLAPGARFLAGSVNFVIALPLLAVVLGPFWLRRTRRGLRSEIEKRGAGPAS